MSEEKYALLIDADNVSAKYIKPILDELSKYGNVTYKRIYGDWTSTQHASWITKSGAGRMSFWTGPSTRSSSTAIRRGRMLLTRR